MNIAVIKTGGKQYLVSEGTTVTIEKLEGVEEGSSITFDSVLLMDDGKETIVGTPTVSSKVTGTVLSSGKADKVVVVKYKAKSRYHKKRGHRQPFLKVKIDTIS